MSERALPIIDIGPVRAGDPHAIAAVAASINAACMSAGFFYVRNHGVDQSIIGDVVAASRAFFALPTDVKRTVSINKRHRGFSALGDATMYGAKRPDYKEFFTMGLELPDNDPDVQAGQPLRGPNNWPDFMPELRGAMSAYYQAVGSCGADLLKAIALSLRIDAGFFADRYRKRLQRTQLIYYPPQPAEMGKNLFGVAPHTDFGCITLLWQDDSGGLEVLDRASKTWIGAAPIPGTLVVNVGDLLARWTNDRYTSTPHRVINRSGHERYSIATFYDPDFGAMVDPCDLGVSPGDRRYEPITAGQHILNRLDQSFGYRKRATV
ncbi:MAG TPA: 2-oxoglutarate and iron-dependent oxygenase domain-containing protein [Dongiaceae bacterium]|nr:2-oxoglutarate and iron-dependent oxygenase domain-containing protein [Dongiaceae bacterium]